MDTNNNEQNGFDGMPQQPYAQPGMDANQQYYGQPGMDMSQQQYYGQPGMDMSQQQYGQPGMDANQQYYAQPGMDMSQQQYYGQPGMDMNQQFNAQQFYGQPGAPADTGKKAKKVKQPKVKKPLGKGAIAGIIGGSVALVAAVVCGIIFIPKLFKSDKEVVLNAFEATFGVDVNGTAAAEAVDMESLIKKQEEEGAGIIFELKDDNLGIGFTVDEQVDKKNKEISLQMGFDYDSTDVIDVEFYTDDTNMYVALPQIIDGYFIAANQGFFDELNEFITENASDADIDLASLGLTGDLYFFQEAATRVNSDAVAAVENIWDKAEFKKQGKAKVDVNGKTVNAKEYTITIAEEDLEESISKLFDAILEEYKNMGAFEESGMDMSVVESSFEQVKQFIPSIISQDLVIKVYIDDDKVVKIASAAKGNIVGVVVEYDFYADFGDDLAGELSISVAGEKVGISYDIDAYKTLPSGSIKAYAADESVVVDISSSGNADEKDFDVTTKAELTVAGEKLGYVEINMKHKDFAFDNSASLYVADELFGTLAWKGELTDIEKGSSYTIVIDSLSLSDANETYVDFNGKYVYTAGGTAKKADTSKNTYDILNMSTSDLENMLLDNLSKVEEWLELLGDLGLSVPYAEEEPEEPEEPTVTEPAEDETILRWDGMEIEIFKSLDGTVLDYTCEYFIDYRAQGIYDIEYTIEMLEEPSQLFDYIYVPDDGEILNQESGTVELEDGTVLDYVMQSYTAYDENCLAYIFAKNLENGMYLVAYVDVYDEGYNNLNELAKVLASDCYSILSGTDAVTDDASEDTAAEEEVPGDVLQ